VADRKEKLLAAVLGALAVYAFFREYLPPYKCVHLWSDIAGYHYPLQWYAFDALKHGRLPLWDATIYCGISFAGNVQAALFYLPTWLLYTAFLPFRSLPFKALEAFTFVHVWVAFLLGYFWLRGRAGRMAALLGAAVLACSGFMMWETLHTGVICAAVWIPLGLWGIDEAVEQRRWRPMWKVAASLALSFLAGYPAAWFPCCAVMLAYATGSRAPLRALGALSAALAAAALLVAVELLPALDARRFMMLEPKYGPGAWGARELLLSFFSPNWFDFNPGHPTDYEPGCFYFYLGLPALFAIAWAFRQGRFRPYIQPLLGAAVILVLANPPETLIRTVERIRVLEATMSPLHFYAGLAPMAALISAIGIDAFLKAKTRAWPRWALAGVSVLLAAWSIRQLLISAHGGRFPVHQGSLMMTAVALAFFALGLWGFRGAAGRNRVVMGALVLFTVAVDFKVYGAGRWFNALPGDEDNEHVAHGMAGLNDAAFAALRANRHYRIALDPGAAPYSTDLRFYGLTTPQGFDPFLPAQYRDTVRRWVEFQTNRLFFPDLRNEGMLQQLGVRYVITHAGAANQPFLAASPDYRLIGRADSFYMLYEYTHAKPAYRWEDGARGTATPVAWTPEHREMMISSERGGRFVLVEQFYTGWHASVDGRSVPIERWGGAFQSIAVPPGRHRVEFRYAPASLLIGAIVSGLSALVLMFAALRWDTRLRRARPADPLTPCTIPVRRAPPCPDNHSAHRRFPEIVSPIRD
jgi:hypothetical protein